MIEKRNYFMKNYCGTCRWWQMWPSTQAPSERGDGFDGVCHFLGPANVYAKRNDDFCPHYEERK